jgi:hypothetical protein
MLKSIEKNNLPFFEELGEAVPVLFEERNLLWEIASREVLIPAEKLNLDIQPLGFHKVFDNLLLIEKEKSDWVVMPLEQDPLFEKKFPVPFEALKRLERISEGGIDFNLLYVAHEIKKGSIKEGSYQELKAVLAPPPPLEIEEFSEMLGGKAYSLLKITFSLVEKSFSAGLKASNRLLVGSSRKASKIIEEGKERNRERLKARRHNFCPMILGVITKDQKPKKGDPGFFFLLGAWRW